MHICGENAALKLPEHSVPLATKQPIRVNSLIYSRGLRDYITTVLQEVVKDFR